MDNNNNLKRHITPDALQQIVDLLDESQKKHCVIHWLILACKLAITYDDYSNIHAASESMNMDIPLETIEEIIEEMNIMTNSVFSLSELMDYKSNLDDHTIDMYKEYKEQLNYFSDKIFIPIAAEKLSEELYVKYKYNPAAVFRHATFSNCAKLILDSISGKIDDNEFKELFSKIKMGDKTLNTKTVLLMTKDANKWVSRYLEILKE